jgi:hypothetical protein
MYSSQPLERDWLTGGAFAFGREAGLLQKPANPPQPLGLLGMAAGFVVQKPRRLVQKDRPMMEDKWMQKAGSRFRGFSVSPW